MAAKIASNPTIDLVFLLISNPGWVLFLIAPLLGALPEEK
jgi:hypothetical protein